MSVSTYGIVHLCAVAHIADVPNSHNAKRFE